MKGLVRTPLRSIQNAFAFNLKRQRVLIKTQGRFS